jgi:hypothetical protein
VYLSYTALVLLSAVSGATAGLWTVDIDESPAPPPGKGPPFSAHASRNPALLPYQIVGIVGAYIGSVLIVGSLLLTVGRSLRKKAQNMALQPKEMVKPLPKAFDPSPLTPGGGSQKSWFSPRHLRSKKSATSSIRSGVSTQLSPGMESVTSFDNNVLEADRARRQEEMERLYAAVMTHQDQKNSQSTLAGQKGVPPPEYTARNPPRLITDAPGLRHLQPPGSNPQSPTTPKSPIRAIYPPGSSVPNVPLSPTSPIRAEMPNYSFPQQFSSSDLKTTREHRTPSFGSGQNTPSASAPTKLRKSLRNLKISAPMIKDDNSDGARTPLSPRFYTDPGIPPEPPTSRTNETISPGFPPATPGTGRSFPYESEELDEIRDLPHPNPQRQSAYNYANPAQLVTDAASTRPDPTKSSTATGPGTLPFREMNRQYAQQQQQQNSQAAFPLSPGHWNAGTTPNSAGGMGYLTSAGPVKTTFLDARRDRAGGGIRTGQATPYSPYMPFTPLTPVTPRLTTRAERKQREKEARRARGAITEEEKVADEKDLWSSGY